MKNNKNILIVLVVIIVIVLALYFFYFKNAKAPVVNNTNTTPSQSSPVVYKNAKYGFVFSLPNDWKGYSIVENTWQGNPLTTPPVNETGPKLLIRNPNWTEAKHYEDIPILVFSLAQWKSYTAENFAVSAAPIPASELSRNDTYVFALPPRWDFDYSQGYAEAEKIIEGKPLKAYYLK